MSEPFSPEQFPVVILCGGRGTRLREESEWRPKPLVSIGEKPILWHIMKTYAHYGLTHFILCLGYKGEMIQDYFLNYDLKHSDIRLDLGSKQVTKLSRGHEEERWSVILANTGLDTMTGGRVKIASQYILSENFCLTYGDGVADIDIQALLQFHQRMNKWATITAVRPPSRYGELKVDEQVATTFAEKPQANEGWINGGFFVLNKKVLALIEDKNTVWEQEPLHQLVQMKELAVYQHEGFWQCMDTYREMELLNKFWYTDKAPWKLWE